MAQSTLEFESDFFASLFDAFTIAFFIVRISSGASSRVRSALLRSAVAIGSESSSRSDGSASTSRVR
jgi:hypothetical protein